MCERRPCPRKTHAHEEMTYEKSLCPRRDHVSGSRPCPRRDDISEEVMSKKRSCSRRAHVQEEVMFKKRSCPRRGHVQEEALSRNRSCQQTDLVQPMSRMYYIIKNHYRQVATSQSRYAQEVVPSSNWFHTHKRRWKRYHAQEMSHPQV